MNSILNLSLLIIIILLLVYIFSRKNTENFSSYNLPKKIYLYWHDKNNPVILKNINCWRKNIPQDWNIEFVNDDNIQNYVSHDFLDKYKKKLDHTKFSDFLRLELLYNYGGVWMDALILVTNGTFLDKYRNEMFLHEHDVTLYNFPTRNTPSTIYLENWWIMAPQYSNFICDVRDEFNKSFDMGFVNYKNSILLPSGVDLTNTIGYDDDVYLLQHAIINYLVHIGKEYNINIKNANDNMFKIQEMLEWDHYKIARYLLEDPDWTNIVYAVKLIGTTRKYYTEHELINVIRKI